MSIHEGVNLPLRPKILRGPRTWAWTEERIERLKEYLTQGLSASQIAAEFDPNPDEKRPSRCAVIGKVRRLGLRQGVVVRTKPSKPARAKRPAYAVHKRPPEDTLPKPSLELISLKHVDAPPSLNLTLFQLKDATEERAGTCHWPYGLDPPFQYCGQPTKRGSWCPYHLQRVRA